MSLEHLTRGFRFNQKVLGGVTAGLEDEDWLRRACPEASHAYWVLGHLAVSRRSLLRGLGKGLPQEPWEATFAKGSQPGQELTVAPSVLAEDFNSSGRLLQEWLGSLDEKEASSPYIRKLPDGAQTKEEAARFYLWHESYHLGQLGILRKVCGKPGLA
jgi:DinB family protein